MTNVAEGRSTVSRQGAFIRERLAKLGMSQGQFGRLMGIDKSFITRLCNDKTQPHRSNTPTRITDPVKIQKMAAILHCQPDDLYIAAGKLPPDVEPTILRYPELITAIRKAAAKMEGKT